MRTIIKGVEPSSLTAHRQKDFSDYDNYRQKDDLRLALVTEQHGLCCYCMCRIKPDYMKIEHWHCRSDCIPGEDISYHNLLGGCKGGENQPPRLQYCDTKKGNKDLKWNPADASRILELWLRYMPDGTIRSSDEEFDTQLDEVLNLNLPYLKNQREGVLFAILKWWTKERENGPVSLDQFQQHLNNWNGGTGDLKPYCQIAVWWLEQRIASMII
jgi:uncharacterized protein (TIGR02646 family)